MSPATKSKSKDKKSGKDSGYNHHPLLGTFQVLDSVSINDETDVINGAESDNGSYCSVESEDQHKVLLLPLKQQQEVVVVLVPGGVAADNDKREKVRQKNERKHQRQKERRAQELYDKCSTYLMSRKLENLTQQLVAMGISQEHATTALMMNQGKVEESVHWFFDRGDEEVMDEKKQKQSSHGNLKIDITEELARITEMELQLKFTRQEIERAVVQAKGDLDRAEQVMMIGTKYEESSLTPPSLGKQETQPVPSPTLQPTRDDKNFNYTTKSPSTMMVQPMKRPELKLEWPKPQQSAVLSDKKWQNTGHVPSASYSLSPSSQPATRVNEVKNAQQQQQQQANIESVVAMRQRPQVVSPNPVPSTSWQPAASMEMMKSNGFIQTRSASPNNLNPNQIYQQQLQYQNQKRFSSTNNGGNGGSWTRSSASSPSISAASSLGLFSAVNSAGTSGVVSSPIDWNSGGSVDYTSIDWSLDQGLSQHSRVNGNWSELKNSSYLYDADMNRYSVNGSMGGSRVNSSNGVSMENAGVGSVVVETQQAAANSEDWTSPFEGKDIFSLSRQYVPPSL